MSIVEKAGGDVHDLPASSRPKAVVPGPSFKLDKARMAERGLFHEGLRTSQMALELRAIKRRLLRRIGYIRASGDRQLSRSSKRQRNLILVTSTRAGEGKTFCALNLALSLAIEDKIETLLVDADVPRPKVRYQLGLPVARGLTDLIEDSSKNISALTWRAEDCPFSVLPEGGVVDQVSDLFASSASQRLWTRLSATSRDRLVIIDAPPVLATTEAVILAKYVDEIVFVVEANTTPEPAVASAIDELLDINPNVSLVLNRCLVGSGGSHYGSYEYYGNDTRSRTGALEMKEDSDGASNS